MTDVPGFPVSGGSAAVIREQVGETQSEELAALTKAAALMNPRFTRQETEAACRRCEIVRSRNNRGWINSGRRRRLTGSAAPGD